MKLLGVLWNSMEDHWKDALVDLEQYGKITKIYSIDFKQNFEPFIKSLYPFSETEMWKAEYKIAGLLNQYKDNKIHIVLIDIPKTEKVFLPQKDKYMYSNVLEMKVAIRHKYKHLLKDNAFGKQNGVSYDNVFHMTDDELEYEDNLFSILPFLIKYNTDSSAFELDDFIEADNIKVEPNGSRNAFWLTPSIMFKEQTDGTFESYSELFDMYLMQYLGLNGSCYYGLAQYNGKLGVITKRLNQKGENLYLGSDILNSYGIYDKKELIYYNSLNMFPMIIKSFCTDNNYIYNEGIETEFEKLFMYDLMTMQADRNPSNWAIICNEETRQISLKYFDHSNMLFFDNARAVEDFLNGNLDLEDYICNNITTFLIYDSSDIELCHLSKFIHIKKFFERADERQLNIFNRMFSLIDHDLINQIINEVEVNNGVKLPEDFINALIQGFDFYKQEIIKIRENLDKGKAKKLCKKD